MCRNCLKELAPDRGTTCLEKGSYIANFLKCCQCKVLEPIADSNRVEDTDNEDEETITYTHSCSCCNHLIAEHTYTFSVIEGYQEYTMECDLCGIGEASVSVMPNDPRQMVTLFHTTVGCGHCNQNSGGRRRRNIHNQILSEVDMAMKQAKQFQEPSIIDIINKCINAETSIGKILNMQADPNLYEKAKLFLVAINDWYHELNVRQASVYYLSLKSTFPGVSKIQALTEPEFKKCFQIFEQSHAIYEQYRIRQTQSEYAAKYAERYRDNMAEENGMNDKTQQQTPETYEFY